MDGEISGVLPDKEHPISRGGLCVKGWNAAAFVDHPDRLRTPLIRRDDGGDGDRAPAAAFEEATWDEALDLIAERLSDARDQFGPDSIGFLASAKCTNEENYLIQKLARAVIETNNVDHCARL
jgi:predicted molibdopterin-dependent oxidoreductase YjgC